MIITNIVLGVITGGHIVIVAVAVGLIAYYKFFKNQSVDPIPQRFEDLYNFDFPALLENATYIGVHVNPYVETDRRFEYECTLNPPFLNAFDTLKMRILRQEREIETDRYIYLVLMSKRRTLTSEQIAFVVDAICEAWKEDRSANPNGSSVNLFKTNRTHYQSFDQGDDTITMKNDVKGGLSVEFQMIYEKMKQLGQEFKQ